MNADPNYQEDWQLPQKAETNAGRIGIGVSLLVFVAIALVILFKIIWGNEKSKPFVQAIYVTHYGELVRHSPFVEQDVNRLAGLLENPEGDIRNFHRDVVLNDEKLRQFGQNRIDKFEACGSDDLAIFYVSISALGSKHNHAEMRSTAAGGTSGTGVSLVPLLQHLEEIPAATKLLLLDTGQMANDIGNGMLFNEFPFRLHQLLNTGDQGEPFADNLWVIVSHGLFQNSNVSDVHGGSVFGLSVAAALSHLKNHAVDDEITIDELYESICGICSQHTSVTENDNPVALQTPLLMRGGHGVILKRDRGLHAEAMKNAIVIHQTQIREADLFTGLSQTSSEDEEAVDSKADGASETDAKTEKEETGQAPGQAGDDSTLQQVWNLRDQLAGRSLSNDFSPVDVAPHLWLQLNYQLVELDNNPSANQTNIEILKEGLQHLVDIVENNPARNADFSSMQFPVLKRLVDIVNDPSLRTPGSISHSGINELLQEYRDLYFRSRYYVDWCRRELEVGVFNHVQPVHELLVSLRLHRKDFIDPATFSEDDEWKLQNGMRELRAREDAVRSQWNTAAASQGESGFRQEQLIRNLLSSPLVVYPVESGGPDADGDSGSTSDACWPIRSELKTRLSELRKDNVGWNLEARAWASEIWTGGTIRAEELARNSVDQWKTFYALSGHEIDTSLAIRLPANWQDNASQGMIEYLAGMQVNGVAISNAIKSHQQELANRGAWADSIVLARDNLDRFDRQLDQHLALKRISFMAEEENVRIGFRPGFDTRALDLDVPDDQRFREFFFETSGNPANVKLVIEVSGTSPGIKGEELAGLFEIRLSEDGKPVTLDDPFEFSLERRDGGWAPLVLSFDADPARSHQAEQEIELTLRIANSGLGVPPVRQFKLELPKPQIVPVTINPGFLETDSFTAVQGDSLVVDDANQLTPFFNRFRPFDFEVRNDSGRPKSISVDLFSVPLDGAEGARTRLPGRLVHEQVRGNAVELRRELNRLRRQVGEPLATVAFDLSPDENSGNLNWGPPADEPPAEDNSESGAGPQEPAEEPPATNVTHGLLCRVTFQDDADAYQRSQPREAWYWFEFQQMRLENLVNESPEFVNENEFKVRLAPEWQGGNSPFEDGAKCEIFTDRPNVDITTKECVVLDGPNELVINLAGESLDEPMLVYVGVNGYRGVYIYELTTGQVNASSRRHIDTYIRLRDITFDPAAGEKLAKIRSGNTWILKPTMNPEYHLDLLVDVKDQMSDDCRIELASRRGGGEWVPIGDPRILDRKIGYEARINEKNGRLEIKQTVDDHAFQWKLPTAAAPSGRYMLRVNVYEGISNVLVNEELFTILFDDEPPTGQIVRPARMTIDERTRNIDIVVEATDVMANADDVAGAGVNRDGFEVFVDKNGNKKLDEDDGEQKLAIGPPERSGTESDRWTIPVNLQENGEILTSDPENKEGGGAALYQLCVRLGDRLNNETPLDQQAVGHFTLIVENSEMVEAARKAKLTFDAQISFYFQLTNNEKGRVQPEDVKLTVTRKDDPERVFAVEQVQSSPDIRKISDLPLGEYVLTAEGQYTRSTITNKPIQLEGTAILVVNEDSAETIEFQVELLRKEDDESQ